MNPFIRLANIMSPATCRGGCPRNEQRIPLESSAALLPLPVVYELTFFPYGDRHAIKCITLAVGKCTVCGSKCIHAAVQPSPQSISRTCSFSQTGTVSSSNTNSQGQATTFLLSVSDLAPLGTSSACMRATLLQSCLTLSDPRDHSLPGPSVHEIRHKSWSGCHALLQGIFPTQGLNLRLLHLLHWQAGSLPPESYGMCPFMAGLFLLISILSFRLVSAVHVTGPTLTSLRPHVSLLSSTLSQLAQTTSSLLDRRKRDSLVSQPPGLPSSSAFPTPLSK